MFVDRFDPLAGVLWVRARAFGPLGGKDLRLILDTGTVVTVLDTAVLDALGYSARMATARSSLLGVDGAQEGYRLSLDRFEALGFALDGCSVLCHDFDERLGVDGLIGMDLLAGRVVTIDGIRGLLTVESQG